MPYIAKDTRTGEIVWAFNQTKDAWLSLKKGYRLECLECHSPLVPKGYDGGIHQYHFAHLSDEDDVACSLRVNSTEDHKGTGLLKGLHRFIQMIVYQTLEDNGAEVEYKIGDRHADVCLPSENLVFEVQTSPQKDVDEHERTADYQNLGYTTIWIEIRPKDVVTAKHASAIEQVRNRKLLFTLCKSEMSEMDEMLPLEMRSSHITFNAYKLGKITGLIMPLKRVIRWIASGRIVLHNTPIEDDIYWEVL